MNKIKNIIRFITVLLLFSNNAHAQVDREFWFAIPKETNGHGSITVTNNVSFKVTAMSLDAQVTISMPADATFTPITFTVPAGQSHNEVLAETYAEFAAIYNNNAPLGSSSVTGQTNRGILITADNDITVYYDYDNDFNRDLFSLKGKNALGTNFYTPFQNIWWNDTAAYNPDPYSTIEIVATENATDITISPRPGQRVEGRPTDAPWTITLNRGQAYTVRARYAAGRSHLTGLNVSSTKKIAVVINDDSVRQNGPSCRDINGDQLVPTNIIGSEYVVMTGDRSNTTAGIVAPYKYTNNVGEQIFVTSADPGTVITFRGRDGTVLYTTGILNAGQSDYLSVDINNANMSSIYISATDLSKKFYTYHITGIGCELGGGIIPPITNCTGSSEVSFYRSNTVNDITVNLMIPYDTSLPFADANQSHNYFTLITYNNDGSIASSVPIPGNSFEANAPSGWAVLRMTERNFNARTTLGRAHRIINTRDFFHLGMTNGTSGATNKYGYFSSFNVAKAAVRVSQSESVDKIGCLGDTITLVASGGLNYTWHYGTPSGPPLYLSDGNSPTPDVINAPVGSHNFYVEVQQSKCFGIDTLKVNVTILPVVKAIFEVDKSAVCAPDTVVFTNRSDNADVYTWRKQIGSNPEFTMSFSAPNNPMLFREPMNNPSVTNPLFIKYTLIAESNQGCADRMSKTITIFPHISADFQAPDTLGCNPLPVQFTNNSGGNTDKYYWNFGDQGSSVEEDPLHIFYNYGSKDTTYNVQLVAKSPFFCTDTARTTVRVHPFIEAHYAVDTVRGCSPLNLQIQNASLGAISRYKWDYNIGPADTSDRSDAFYTYTYHNSGAANVDRRLMLSVFNAAGCIDTMSRLITIYPEILTDFIAGPQTTGCNPLTVNFTNQSNPAANSFYWDFGDNANSIDKDPVHVFENLTSSDVTYKVKLRATTSNLCPGFDSTLITVRAFIGANFTIDKSESCTPFTLNLHNESVGGITQYNWDFGDGSPIDNSAGPTISHLYSNTGVTPLIRNIVLDVEGTGGCRNSFTRPITLYPEIDADFTPDKSQGCNTLSVTFANNSTPVVANDFTWTFGDGTSSNDIVPVHLFSHLASTDQTYPVKLVARSIFNCKDSVTKNITVYSYIDARFTIDNADGCSPLLININDASVGGIVNKVWYTGDNNYFGNITQHTYTNVTNAVLNKNFRLIVSNSHGCQDTLIRPVIIYPKVNATFNTNVTQGCNPLTINYTNLSNPFPVPQRYRWEFGDSASSNTTNLFLSHTFENLTSTEKTYKTRLFAYSIYNCADTAEINITVYPFIKANFGFNNPVGCSPHLVSFTNGSWPGANGFTWVFGDGNVQQNNSVVVNHQYRNLNPMPLVFKPMLIADYNGRCQDTMQLSLEVYPEVHALFIQDTLQGCHPSVINFFNTSMNAHRYNWYFGDKGSSILVNPNHTYSNFSNVDSIYNVKLVASSIFNCTNELTKVVTIYPKPKARFNVVNSINCPPFAVPIENLSEAGDSYLWTFGDGNNFANNTLGTITHTYDNLTNDIATYELGLRVETIHNCSDQVSQNINVYPHVIADFAPDTAGCSPLLVAFKNNTVRGDKFIWDFDDGSSSKVTDPAHRFFNPSVNDTTFTIQLIAQSKFNCSDTTTRNVTVYPQPEARFTALPSHLYFPDAITNIINETNPGYWSFSWNFDDGQTSTLKDPVFHEYIYWGNYNIKLVAQSANCTDSTTQRVRIFPPMPIPDFDISNDRGCVPLTVGFTDRSTWANTYYWEFDDGSVSTEINPAHTYTTAGKYQVKLTVTGDGGTAYTYRDVTVHPKPEVLFDVAPKLVMLPNADVNYYNKSKLGARFLWDFGDGDQSSDPEPRHRYSQTGVFTVALTVWSEYNCYDSAKLYNIIKVLGPRDIRFPNAFTPNTSGPSDGTYTELDPSNDIFHPYSAGVGEYHLEIYNRWGEKLFESDDINIGWDGYYKGELCKADVYVYKAKGKFLDGTPFEKVGDVTLLR